MSSLWEDPRRVLARHGLTPKRSYSQNFLTSERVVRAIVQACELGPTDNVIELGPGCGTLTLSLSAACARVYAVERDPDMLHILERETDRQRVVLVRGDAKQLDICSLAEGAPITVAGNVPYAITGAILRNLIEQSDALTRAVLMVQREVRDRLTADADTPEYGALSVFAQQVFQVQTVLHVPKTAFHPPPKVTSSVVKFTPLAQPRAPRSPAFDKVVRAAFQARRKTLRKALSQSLGAELSRAALDLAAIDGKRRGETLTIEEFGDLAAGLDAAQARAVPDGCA